MIHPSFDSDYFMKCVIDWINADGEIFVRDMFNESNKRRRLNCTKKLLGDSMG